MWQHSSRFLEHRCEPPCRAEEGEVIRFLAKLLIDEIELGQQEAVLLREPVEVADRAS